MHTKNFARRARAVGFFSLLGYVACAPAEHDLAGPAAGGAADDVGTTQDEAIAAGVALRSSSTASGVNVTSLALAKPAGVAAGDFLLARVANRNQVGATIAPPAGWSLLRSDQSASQLKSFVLFKVAGASEPASYSFGVSIASNAAGSIMAFSGVDPANPIDASSG